MERLRAWDASWSIPPLAGIFLGAFTTRLLFEVFPQTLSFLADPLYVLPLSLGVALLLSILWWRRVLHNRTALPSQAAQETLAFYPPLLLGFYLLEPDPNLLAAGLLLLLVVLAALGPLLDWRMGSRGGDLLPLAIMVLALYGYWRTLLPSLMVGDSGELQTAAATLGIPHATGYPLYLLLGRFFTLLPFGDAAYRINLLSAVTGALALVPLYWAARSLMASRLLAALVALLFGFGALFWSQAVVAEVYTLHLLFVAALLWLALPGNGMPGRRRLPLMALLLGLGLTHHRTILLMLPAVALGLAFSWREMRMAWSFRQAVLLLILLLAPLLLYLLLPWRWEQTYGRPMAPQEFVNLILGSRFAPLLHWDAWYASPERWGLLWRWMLEGYGVLGVALPLLGGVGLALRWKSLAVLLMTFLAYGFFALSYFVPDAEVYFLPVLLVQALLLGVGAEVATSWLGGFLRRPGLGRALAYLLLMGMLFVEWRAWSPSSQFEESRLALEMARSFPLHELPANSLILSDVDRYAPLLYASRVLRRRADLEVVMPDTEASSSQLIEGSLIAGRPIYLARYLPAVERRYRLNSIGPLAKVEPGITPSISEVPSGLQPLFQGGPLLIQVEPPAVVKAGSALPLDIIWGNSGQISEQYQPTLRLKDRWGEVWAQEARKDPVGGLYPMPFWRSGEVVRDHHSLLIPWYLPPGEYDLELLLVLPNAEVPQSATFLGRVRVLEDKREVDARFSRRSRFENGWLLKGQELEGPLWAGSRLEVRVLWEGGEGEFNITLELRDRSGVVVARETAPQASGRWFASRHLIALPRGLEEGRYHLYVQLSSPEGYLRVRSGWLRPLKSELHISSFDLRQNPASQPELTNFGDKIALLGYSLERRPGGREFDITLTWEALQEMRESYTVFLHLRDGEGRLRGQVDSRPLQGSHPTHRWRVGERIRDRYRLRWDEGAPPGDYQIELGLYLPSTMQRLPILDEAGKVRDDHLVIAQATLE